MLYQPARFPNDGRFERMNVCSGVRGWRRTGLGLFYSREYPAFVIDLLIDWAG